MAIVTGLLAIELRVSTSSEPIGLHMVGYVYDSDRGLDSLTLAAPADWIDQAAVRAAVESAITAEAI
jgi:hypothetical protein